MDELEYIFSNQYRNKIAVTLDKGIETAMDVGSSYIDTMGLGADRAVRNLSYFFDGYEDVYEKIVYEDDRFLLMLKETVLGRNPVKELIGIFFDHLLANLDGNELKYLTIALKETFHAAGFVATTGGVRVYLATAVSELIYQAVLRNQLVKRFIGTGGNILMALSGGYGAVELAAQAKDRLRYSNPILFHSLHLRNLEMAYFLVEPNISSELYMIGSNKKSIDEVEKSINKLIYSS